MDKQTDTISESSYGNILTQKISAQSSKKSCNERRTGHKKWLESLSNSLYKLKINATAVTAILQ